MKFHFQSLARKKKKKKETGKENKKKGNKRGLDQLGLNKRTYTFSQMNRIYSFKPGIWLYFGLTNVVLSMRDFKVF